MGTLTGIADVARLIGEAMATEADLTPVVWKEGMNE